MQHKSDSSEFIAKFCRLVTMFSRSHIRSKNTIKLFTITLKSQTEHVKLNHCYGGLLINAKNSLCNAYLHLQFPPGSDGTGHTRVAAVSSGLCRAQPRTPQRHAEADMATDLGVMGLKAIAMIFF